MNIIVFMNTIRNDYILIMSCHKYGSTNLFFYLYSYLKCRMNNKPEEIYPISENEINSKKNSIS